MPSHTVQVIRHAVFDLLSHQEYIQPLREEVEEVLQSEGWTKSAIDQMHKIDSFVKESQRLHPSGFRQSFLYVTELRTDGYELQCP